MVHLSVSKTPACQGGNLFCVATTALCEETLLYEWQVISIVLWQHCLSLFIEGGRDFLELLVYAFGGVDVNPSPGSAPITGEGSRC